MDYNYPQYMELTKFDKEEMKINELIYLCVLCVCYWWSPFVVSIF